ncbi:MAG: hypothetical protein ACRER2_12030 [Methylococcales bacterium]
MNPMTWDARLSPKYALRVSRAPRQVDQADWSARKSSVHAIDPGIPGGSL